MVLPNTCTQPHKAGSWENLSIQRGTLERDHLRTTKSQDKGSSWNGGWH